MAQTSFGPVAPAFTTKQNVDAPTAATHTRFGYLFAPQ